MSGPGNIKVVVRCRPLNSKEMARGAIGLVRMEGNQTIITQPTTTSSTNSNDSNRPHRDQNSTNNTVGAGDDTKAFTFDRSFWSVNPKDPNYASQDDVYNDLGQELLDHAFHGYNCCIFAYGQTGSGKSYTMMGYGADKGIIPKTCAELFSRIASDTNEVTGYQVEVSYLEIYNEKVRDLLNPRNKSNLKVREHPSLGPYVEDLSRLAVKSFDDIDHLMNEGNKARTVAATNMNETSSRSHAVFTIFLTSRKSDATSKVITEKVSRISLVDLAGSERADSTGATGARLKEGANINRSLATLGKVIAALAEKSSLVDPKKGKKSKEHFIPYRDSVLTWLLKDCLGGNSRTAMIAAISPADYDETLSTLRYADQAKRIKNKPVINEDPNAKLIRELKEELQALRDTLMTYAPEEVEKISSQTSPQILGSRSTPRLGALQPSPKPLATSSTASPSTVTTPSALSTRPPSPATPAKEISFSDAFGVTRKLTMTELVDQLKASQKLLDQVNQTWEEKLVKTQGVHYEREKALESLGILLEKDNGMGIHTPKQIPHLVNLNEDPLMSECLMYQLKHGITRVGRFESDNVDIRLSGPNIMHDHCYFENDNGLVTIFPATGSMTMVNGMGIATQKRLHNGYRIILGDYHVFRFNHPEEVRKERDRLSSDQQASFGMLSSGRNSRTTERSESPALLFSDGESSNYSISGGGPPEIVDWNFAKREAVLNYYYNSDSNFINGPNGINNNNNNNSINGELSKRISLLDDETMSRTTASSKRFSNSSLPLSTAITNDDEITKQSSNRHSGSNLSIDTGIFSAQDGLSNMDLMEAMNDDFDSASGIIRRENARLDLKRQKEEYEERIRLATLYHEQPSHIQDMEIKLQRVIDDMQRMMDNQKLAYESKIKRLSSKLPLEMLRSPMSPLYSLAEQRLISKVVTHWRRHRYVLMAEAMLVHAIFLKEANIIAKDLGKDVSYQFTVVHDNYMVSPWSFWEATSALQLQSPINNNNNNNNDGSTDFDSDQQSADLDLQQAIKPCVGVQVIDRKHNALYIWSLPEIKRRLKQMQNLYNFTDRPLSRSQFTWKDPFYQTPCPRYTLIGLATVSMRNLALQVPLESVVDVFDRNTGTVMGKLRLLVAPIARSITNNNKRRRGSVSFSVSSLDSNHSFGSAIPSEYRQPSSPTQKSNGDTNGGCLLRLGQKQVFEIHILELSDLYETMFTQVHAQFRLSAFGNVQRYSDQDKMYATEPVSGFGKGPVHFNYAQTLATTITSEMMNAIMAEELTIELYGQARPDLLYGVVEQNIEREKTTDVNNNNTTDGTLTNSNNVSLETGSDSPKDSIIGQYSIPSPTTEKSLVPSCSAPTSNSAIAPSSPLSSPATPYKRLKVKAPIRSYTDDGVLLKERHHVVAYVQLCELGEDGEYVPVNVVAYSPQDRGCFYLRQGLQRRLKITMVHDSGVRLPWKNVINVVISNVSLASDKDDQDSIKQSGDTVSSELTSNKILNVNLHEDQPLEFYRDGTCMLMAQGPWDSTLHDFVHLNRITAPQQRIRATLTWQVTCDKTTQPLSFSMNFDMKIHSRDLVPPSNTSNNSSSAILHYFSSAFYQYQRMSYKLRGLFSVHLSPPLTRQVSQLWRLNTANKYVRGEELLGPERALRDISLIEEYREATRRMVKRQQVAATQQTLALIDQQRKRHQRRLQNQQQQQQAQSFDLDYGRYDGESAGKGDQDTIKLHKIVQLWKRRFGVQKEIVINHKPPVPISSPMSPTASSYQQLAKEDLNLKLTPHVNYILPNDTVTKKGYLWHPQPSESDTWVKHWFSLRRPFIMVYQDQTEIEELAVIDLTSVRVDHRKDLEDLLQKPHAFAIYTTNNAYLFQAKDHNDMIDWITKVDQFYPVDSLTL
ncbi:hypothetical protein BC941DRAFT_511726 [Chlamydoabsidia padenii]|nr:hypothetical protein BC941DRAFT_511726 [Chlamydoabsidia padenii]